MSIISAVAVLCVTQQGCGHGLISCFPVVWISLLSLEIPLPQRSSCAGTIPVSFPAIICMTFFLFDRKSHDFNYTPLALVLPNAHKFWNCYFREGEGVISLKWMVFVAKVFKRLKFDCQFKWFLCAAPWRAISCFLSWQVWFLCNTPSWHKTVVVWQSSKYKIHV